MFTHLYKTFGSTAEFYIQLFIEGTCTIFVVVPKNKRKKVPISFQKKYDWKCGAVRVSTQNLSSIESTVFDF